MYRWWNDLQCFCMILKPFGVRELLVCPWKKEPDSRQKVKAVHVHDVEEHRWSGGTAPVILKLGFEFWKKNFNDRSFVPLQCNNLWNIIRNFPLFLAIGTFLGNANIDSMDVMLFNMQTNKCTTYMLVIYYIS
jgi:hypothetical protein